VQSVRDDAIVATGRSDYPNQVNNVLGFPFIFRGALDVQARTINDAMKIAAAQALAALAREDVPDAVTTAFLGRRLTFGPDYIIPAPFDPRLISRIPPAVARAAMDSGVARRPIVDMDGYVSRLKGRLDPVSDWLQSIFDAVRAEPKRVVFADGEELAVIRAANAYFAQGFGVPIRSAPKTRSAEGFTRPASSCGRNSRSSTRSARLTRRTSPSISTRAYSGAATCGATASGWCGTSATSLRR
jgi:malate dehydrogenase (oxaloacetate-decarboxylating)(NADP+)